MLWLAAWRGRGAPGHQGGAPAADAAQCLVVQHGRDDLAARLQRAHDVLLRRAQRVELGRAPAQRARLQHDLRQRRRVREALQDAVQEARVAQVLQPRALRRSSPRG